MITIDFNQIARIAKLVALLGFFLPWVTVSCSSTEMLHATGWQLMTGHPELAGPFAGMQERAEQEEQEPALLVVAAFVVVLIGLVLSLTTRAQAAALNLLVCATLGVGLSYFSVQNMRSEMQREIAEQQSERGAAADTPFFSAEQQDDLSRSVAGQIRIEEQEGYWLTLGALLVAALFALLTLTSKRLAATSATGPPEG
jgi:hypothetical protein